MQNTEIQNIGIDKLLNKTIDTAILAGNKIVEIYDQDDFVIEFKSDESPLTIADKASHDIIYAQLQSFGIPILSEEGKEIDFEIRKNWNTYWLVDPLDGTKEFIKRNGEFTVNIALIDNGTPVLGIIYVPVTKILYFASPKGTFKTKNDNEPIDELIQQAVRLPNIDIKSSFIVVGSRSHNNVETTNYINQLETFGKPIDFIAVGSSLKICMVAEGKADIYPRLGPTMEWDTAAGHAIAKYAGKNILIFETNEPLVYNKKDLLNPWFVVS